MSDREAGWHPHPDDPSRNRYWTGTEWIEPGGGPKPAPNSPAGITPGKVAGLLGGLGVLALALVLALLPLKASGADCGSLLAREGYHLEDTTFGDFLERELVESDCSDARGSRLAVVAGVGVLGAAVLAASLLAGRGPSAYNPTRPDAVA